MLISTKQTNIALALIAAVFFGAAFSPCAVPYTLLIFGNANMDEIIDDADLW